MKINKIVYVVLAAVLLLSVGIAPAQEMTKEEWQAEMNRFTQLRNDASASVKKLTDDIAALQAQSTKLDADVKKCMDDLYALVGSDAEKAAAYRAQIESAESKANELMRLSDADLMARSAEVNDLAAKVKELWGNKLSLIPEFWDRLTALDEKVKSLQTTLAGAGKTYTVGTWAKDRDCLWNISKKSTIYNNAWMWPKIWQGNRDQIKDPDIIHPGQMLKIPPAGEMSADEKAAAKSYYSKKAAP
ncbi:MAG: LysM peptidoglycan-binding domain-containing protein [Ignavibacteriae bacterium]|nr:LysM peptidoglycan-binding domain-containing protein [Ignavibacteriota bacterium]